MITDATAIYPTMQGLVALVTGVPEASVILADQGGPALEGLYVTYNPIPIRAVGHPRRARTLVEATEDFNESLLGADWQDYEETTVSQMEFMVSVNALNEGARDAIGKLHNAGHRWPVVEFCWANDIAYRSVSETRNLTGLDRASFQDRFQADIQLWMETAITDSVLRANDFQFTIEDGAGNALYSGDA